MIRLIAIIVLLPQLLWAEDSVRVAEEPFFKGLMEDTTLRDNVFLQDLADEWCVYDSCDSIIAEMGNILLMIDSTTTDAHEDPVTWVKNIEIDCYRMHAQRGLLSVFRSIRQFQLFLSIYGAAGIGPQWLAYRKAALEGCVFSIDQIEFDTKWIPFFVNLLSSDMPLALKLHDLEQELTQLIADMRAALEI